MPSELPALQREVTAAGEAHRSAAGGAVERLGHRRPPVDDDRLLTLVGDREPADVEGLEGVPVDAAEDEGGVADLEVGEPVADGLFDHIPLVAGLVGAPAPDLGQTPQAKCLLTGPVEAVVGMLDVGLLFGELRVLRHRPSGGPRGEHQAYLRSSAELRHHRAMAIEHTSPYGPLVETRLRVLSWNLWGQFGPWEQRAPAIVATVAALDPDVACLQEVWSAPDGSMADAVAERLGAHHVYASNDDGPVHSGNAIVSRWPIVRTEWRPLPTGGEPDERRLVLFAEIEGPRGAVQVFCTHLNWRFDHSTVRQAQVQAIGALVEECKPREYPPILAGDMNAAPDSDEIRMLTGRTGVVAPRLVFHDAWEVAGGSESAGMTWSNANPYAALDLEPSRRIDYVFAGWPKRGGLGHVVRAEVVGTGAVDGVVPSDHYGVLAELRY